MITTKLGDIVPDFKERMWHTESRLRETVKPCFHPGEVLLEGAGLNATEVRERTLEEHSTMTRNVELGVKERLLQWLRCRYGGYSIGNGLRHLETVNGATQISLRSVLRMLNEVIPD